MGILINHYKDPYQSTSATVFLPKKHHVYTLPKFNSSPLKSYLPNRKVVFQPPFFRGYVKLQGCIPWKSSRPNKVAGLYDDACIGFPILPMGKVWSAWTSRFFFTIRKSIGWNLKITLNLTKEKQNWTKPSWIWVQNVEFWGVFAWRHWDILDLGFSRTRSLNTSWEWRGSSWGKPHLLVQPPAVGLVFPHVEKKQSLTLTNQEFIVCHKGFWRVLNLVGWFCHWSSGDMTDVAMLNSEQTDQTWQNVAWAQSHISL